MNIQKQESPASANLNRKKIAHIIQALNNGGCENMLLRTLPLLDEFEHVLITLKNEGELSEQFRQKGFEIINIGQTNLFSPFPYFGLIRTVKKIKPDAVITYLFHADMLGRIFIQGFTKYNTTPFLRTTYNHEKYWIARTLEKLTKFFAKGYFANSQSVKDFYEKNIGIKEGKTTVIPNGIDTELFDSIAQDDNFKNKLGIGSDEIVITCVANFHANKGHKYLLEAFEKLYTESEKIRLLLVGDGEEKTNLEEQIKGYESKANITFLGKRTDVPNILKNSDIFILPTMFEGMSNALMEAMASGLPVITTDIAENKELITNGINGILVSTNDSEALKKAVQLIISDEKLRNVIAKNAKEHIKNNYGLSIIIKKWNNALNKI